MKHGLIVEPNEDMILDLLCLIIDRVAPGATRDADVSMAQQVESLVLELQERNREDLGELSGLKTAQAKQLKNELTAQIRQINQSIEKLTQLIERGHHHQD